MVLVLLIAALSAREWILLLTNRRRAVLHESTPVWLPDYAVADGQTRHRLGLLAVAVALARELSGEAELERARDPAPRCACDPAPQPTPGLRAGASALGAGNDRHDPRADRELFARVLERRYSTLRRCC
jgi:hypothetical protein